MQVLIVLGHPRGDSLSAALADAYREGAEEVGADVDVLKLFEIEFDPHVREPSPEDQVPEPAIRGALHRIGRADHLVFVYPTWWGTLPALLKGFLDRVVMPGFAFRFHAPDSLEWTSLWNDKSAQIITTMDTPPLVYRWIYRQPGNNAMKRATLGFCGVNPVRVLNLGPVKTASEGRRRRWLELARRRGRALRHGRWTPGERWWRTVVSWLKALRLQFYPMSWAAYTMGALGAAGASGLDGIAYGWGYLYLFCLEAATVFINERVDYSSDLRNRHAGPFNGGSRVLVDGSLGRDALDRGTLAMCALAAFGAAGALAAAPQSTAALTLVLLAPVATLGYTLPPLRLSYRGLGEVDVAITHSLLMILAGYLFQGGSWHASWPWLASLPLMAAILPSILLAGVPDTEADSAAGKKTLAVRLGRRRTVGLAVVTTTAAAGLAVLADVLGWAGGIYGGARLLVLPHALLAVSMLVLDLRRDHGGRCGRLDTLLVVALSYILWFVGIPLYHLS